MATRKNLHIYVKVLLDFLPNEQKTIDEMQKLQAISADSNCQKFLSNLMIAKQKKYEFFVKIVKAFKLNEKLFRFIDYLIQNRKEKFLSSICEQCIIAAYQKMGVQNVHLIIAKEIDKQAIQKLQKQIEEFLAQKVFLTSEINDNIVGGMILQTEGKTLDLSLRKRMQIIAEIIKEKVDGLRLFEHLED